ncbi:monothiol glutaredoxin-S15, mitochondrial isoform X3 [Amborella trichopoda]|nr:monothiol glutaredoxin-S15, mitochondrial isoform X3 [Amborella trichopoda]|eukprot:XP_020529649.1 monothiol glutaredoxin-S15, mitochondrial isoform X3 [Amborella trichopoda]
MTSWKSWRKWLLDIPLSARNILENSEPKNGVKDFSNWPTFPQLFIKGEFIGGSDIILNMHKYILFYFVCHMQSGELKEKLKDLTAGTSQQKEDSE